MSGLKVQVLGIGLIGPGLTSWDNAQGVLRGEAPYQSAAAVVPPAQRLPAAERRRAGAAVKIAMAVADAACAHADADPHTLASVFTSSSGDGANCHALCEALASPHAQDRLLSPTRFTNSVHNAAAGYWHITVESRKASTSLCAYDDSFGAGLIAALTQVQSMREPVLLVASDTPYPEPLQSTRPLPDSMGVAMILAPADAAGHVASKVILSTQLLPAEQAGAVSSCHEPGLEQLRTAIPAARALPLLEAIAQGRSTRIVLAAKGALAMQIDLTFA